MHRITCVALACAVAACGEHVDDRPREFAYIVRTVFQPNCGAAQCHSTFSQQGREAGGIVIPIVLDSVEGARVSFAADEELLDHFDPVHPGQPGDQVPTLITNLTEEYDNAPRMPYDYPLPEKDLALIYDWINLGGPGVCGSLPTDTKPFNGTMCHGKKEYNCDLETLAFTTPTGRACK